MLITRVYIFSGSYNYFYKEENLYTAGLTNDCRVNLGWYFAVAVRFQNQDQFWISDQKLQGLIFLFLEQSKNELLWPKMMFLATLAKKWWFSNHSDTFANLRLTSIELHSLCLSTNLKNVLRHCSFVLVIACTYLVSWSRFIKINIGAEKQQLGFLKH